VRRVLLIAAVALLCGAAPARAASNACNFSVDDYWTSIDVTLAGTATPPGEVLPGDAVTLTGATAAAALPAYMAQIGYNAGILKAGENQIPVKVWIALQATNTLERTQLAGPVDVQARTTITTAPNGEFLSASPITYTPPALPATTWTAAGGDVVLSQAPAGAITQRLPIGPDDAPRAIKGSAVILADLSPVRFSMDCQPGSGNDTGTGPLVGAPVPFDTRPGPRNQTCLDAAETRSYEAVTFAGPSFDYATGQPFTLSGVRVTGADRVTVRGAGTVEGTQAAAVQGGVLADTTWTPSGTGPIAFSQAPGLGSVLIGARRCVNGIVGPDGTVVDNPAPAVFATATLPPPTPPPPPPEVTPTPTPAAATPTPTPTTQPKPAPVGRISVRSSRLTLKRGKVKLQLACSKAGPCSGTLAVLGRSRRYALAAGKSKTYTVALPRTKANRVKVTLTPASGARVTKTLRLRRT
jgi:hypothetical protein